MKLTKNVIRFKCPACKGPLEAGIAQARDDIACPHCHAAISIPLFPSNPYSRPIAKIMQQMRAIPITFPYFPGLIGIAVSSLVLVILGILFLSVGLAAQVCGVFEGLIHDAQKQMREGSAVERSAQAIAICLYLLFILPFWIVQFPFLFIGSLWSFSRFGSFLSLLLLTIGAAAGRAYWSQIIGLWSHLAP